MMFLAATVVVLLLGTASTSSAKLKSVDSTPKNHGQLILQDDEHRNLLSCFPTQCTSGEMEFWELQECCPKCIKPEDVDCGTCPFGFYLETVDGTCNKCSCTVDGVMDCIVDPDSTCFGGGCQRLRTDATTPTWCDSIMDPSRERTRPHDEPQDFDCSQCQGSKVFYDGCTACTCTSEGEVGACDFADCGFFGYEEPFCYVDCSTCDSKTYFDGCNTCTCDDEGQPTCTEVNVCMELAIPFCFDDEPELPEPCSEDVLDACPVVDCLDWHIPEEACCPVCATDEEEEEVIDLGCDAIICSTACDETWQVGYTPEGECCPQCRLDETKLNYEQCPYGYMYPADDGTGCYVCPRPRRKKEAEPCEYVAECLDPIVSQCATRKPVDEISCRTCRTDSYLDGCGRTCQCTGAGGGCRRRSCPFQAVEPSCIDE